MLNKKNNLFIVISLFIGFIVSYYYNKKLNLNFIFMAIIITILLYILFYFLGDVKESYVDYFTNEYYKGIEDSHYENNNNNNFKQPLADMDNYIKNLGKDNDYNTNEIQQKVRENYIKEWKDEYPNKYYDINEYLTQMEEEEHKNKKNPKQKVKDKTEKCKKICEEEYENNSNSSSEEQMYKKIPEEEHIIKKHKLIYVEEEKQTKKIGNNSNDSGQYFKKIGEEDNCNKQETKTYEQPDINKLVMSTPTPFNINISYNSQNSVNELDNDKGSSCSENIRKKNNPPNPQPDNPNPTIPPNPPMPPNNNLGPITYDNTRIYNNSDWIYGSNAWTNFPDYYIPGKGNNRVCPLMDNMPWSEYKSGDNDHYDNF
jgi:hypothetical protein